jgi:hypothetical protein
MAENDSSEGRELHFKSIKGIQFVPCEFSLIDDWSPILESLAKGSCWTYIVIQRFLNRQKANPNYGKAWLSERLLAEITASSIPTVDKRLAVLTEHKFLELETRNHNKLFYTVLELPSPPVVSTRRADTPKLNEVNLDAAFNAPPPERIAKMESPEHWKNVKDVARYWQYAYSEMMRREKRTQEPVEYGFPNQKELKHLKSLLEEYGAVRVKEAIDHMMSDFRSYIDSYPTIAAFYGYRRSIFPEASVGKPGRKDQWKSSKVNEFKKNGKIGVW